ncbi:hypothetical protein D3C72_1028490 [compost metagenome]
MRRLLMNLRRVGRKFSLRRLRLRPMRRIRLPCLWKTVTMLQREITLQARLTIPRLLFRNMMKHGTEQAMQARVHSLVHQPVSIRAVRTTLQITGLTLLILPPLMRRPLL